jgi:chemotaxis protein CheX
MKTAHDVWQGNQNRETWLTMLQLATEEVFEIMLSSKLDPAGEPRPNVSSEITAMVGLAGQLCGILTLRCSGQTASVMASKMLGVESSEVNQQLWDAIGEICNMVAGNFKNKLTGLSDRCMLSVPTIITGGDYSFHSLADSGALEAVMLFEGQPVLVSLEVHT